MNRTTTVKAGTVERKWFIVDATGIPVGRLAAQVAQVLRGKHKPTFAYNADVGDYVIVVNASKAVLTGGKSEELVYRHTMWPGGLKAAERGKLMDDNPARVVEKAIWGMIPKTKLGKQVFSKLKVYAGEEHPHAAQNPEPLNVKKN